MRRLVLVACAVMVACGPSEAERAFAACQQMMAAKSWSAAEASCKVAMDLDPNNSLYSSAYFTAMIEARYPLPDPAAEALRRQAEALEDAAFTAQRAELRRRLESH